MKVVFEVLNGTMVKLDEIIKQHAEGINRTPQEFLEAVRKSGMSYNESGELCNIVGGKPIPAENQTMAIHLVYERIRQGIMSASEGTASDIASGAADVPVTDGGPTVVMRKVDAPTALESLAKELGRSAAVAEAALADSNIFHQGYAFYKREGGKKVVVTFEEALGISRNYFASLAAAGEGRVAVPVVPKEDYLRPLAEEFQKPLVELEDVLGKGDYFILEGKGWCRSLAGPTKEGGAKAWLGASEGEVRDYLRKHYAAPAEPKDPEESLEGTLGEGDGTAEDITDAVTLDTTEEILDPREKYLGPLADIHEKPITEIERVLGEQKIQLGEEGKFYRTLPERDGQLKGEEVAFSEVNDILGTSFAVERLPIIVEEKKEEVAAPNGQAEVSYGQDRQMAKEWLAQGDAAHTPKTNGIEKVLVETEPVIKPEDVVKRPKWTYIAGWTGAAAVLGLTLWITYDSGKTVGGAGKTVTSNVRGAALIENLNAQVADLEAELEMIRADNYTCIDNKNIVDVNYSSCTTELGETKAALKQEGVAYTALQHQLAAAPNVQEAEKKYEECAADRYGLTFDLEDCLIAEGTSSVEYKDRVVETVVEKEVPIEVEKVVEKEVVKYVEKECPSVECPPARECPAVACPKVTEGPLVQCPPAAECLGAEVLCQEVQASYTSETQAREETDDLYAICEADKEFTQVAYDTCVGELRARAVAGVGDSRYAAIKGIIDSNKSDADKSKELEQVVDSYLLKVGAVETKGSTCAEGLGSVYNMMVSVEDDRARSEFVRLLDALHPCGDISAGTGYIKFEHEE